MAVTQAIGIRPDSIERLMMEAFDQASRERLAREQLAAHQAGLEQNLLLKWLEEERKRAEQEGAASAVTRYLQADPERARTFGYLQETLPPPEGAMYAPATQTVRPVPPGEAATVLKILTEMGKGERAEKRIEGQKTLEEVRQAGREKIEDIRQQGAMERIKARADAQKELADIVAGHKADLQKAVDAARMDRTKYTEAQKTVRAVVASPEIRKYRAEYAKIKQDILDTRSALANPELPPERRAAKQMELSGLEEVAATYENDIRELDNLVEQARQAAVVGPESKPPKDRPGPPPTRQPDVRLRRDPSGKLYLVPAQPAR